MPYVNVKLVKNQVSDENKKRLISGLTDLIVQIMGRDKSLTVINVDELDASQWAIGGKAVDEKSTQGVNIFINIKVSKGTTNPEEAQKMMIAAKEMVISIFGTSAVTNYFIIDELNPGLWGYDGLTMSERSKL